MARKELNADEVIDLTNSFTPVNHCALSDAVIELLDTDESFAKSPVAATHRKKSKPQRKRKRPSIEIGAKTTKEEIKRKKLGDCPICFEDLGKSPLASTQCGHIFCMKCLKGCLKVNKKCPTCRRILKGMNAYHPLYL